ncbi:MAG: polyphosphate kinase 2 [Chloroflexi bacterium]|uniref:ADP/GDP-polyphosphate phosphotransferase n=1 Tax=Candidatus Chlorohelix allophototropha TaxID=3003348 RepID=A0A8T7M8A3_9CHLR|nr:polyphosphate kinase 2 [Chloroflexota bacterium]WJW68206.1 polyphosphate kinase 2 [Chloroflexota bacterium L227-S17]
MAKTKDNHIKNKKKRAENEVLSKPIILPDALEIHLNGEEESPKNLIRLTKPFYEKELKRLQFELVRLQYWVKERGQRLLILFEGRDAAGKGGTIKRIVEPLNPRGVRLVALGKPSDVERTQWYFQRYVAHLPAAGEIVIFDRSWYNRAGVEHVMGFCSDEEYWEFMRACPQFEKLLVSAGIHLIKYWLSVSDEEQEKRFQERSGNPAKLWKLSDMDLLSRERWVEYSKAKDKMMEYTDIPEARWYQVEANDKHRAHLNCINHLLSKFPYQEVLPQPVRLNPRPPADENYIRPPHNAHPIVTDFYLNKE